MRAFRYGVRLAWMLSTAAVVSCPGLARSEGMLRIATAASGEASFSFQPTVCGSDQQNWETLMFVPPMYFDAEMNLKPGIFSEGTPNAESTVWTFKIDPRAKFSDGSPVTAADVKGTWEILANPKYCGRSEAYLGDVVGYSEAHQGEDINKTISGLVAIDNQTLQVTLVKSNPVFNFLIATTHLNPVKAADARALGEEKFWLPENNPKFTGPYILADYQPDLGQARLIANPNWWMDEGPYLDAIQFQFVEDPQTTGVMVLSNQIDASLAQIPNSFRGQAPDYFRPIKSFGYHAFFLRNVAPTDDPMVRKALAMAVDWKEVAKATFAGVDFKQTPQPLDPDILQDAASDGYPYDPEAARQALAQSKYGGPDKLPKILVTPRGKRESNNRALEAVIEYWRKNLGIQNVEFQEMPQGFGNDWRNSLNLTREDVVIRFPDAASYMFAAAHSRSNLPKDIGGYSNPEVDKLLDQALALDSTDPKRNELALEAQRLFMNDHVMLGFGKPVLALNARDYVVNYMKGPDVGLIEPWKIKIERK